jgi:hypothetical protein
MPFTDGVLDTVASLSAWVTRYLTLAVVGVQDARSIDLCTPSTSTVGAPTIK